MSKQYEFAPHPDDEPLISAPVRAHEVALMCVIVGLSLTAITIGCVIKTAAALADHARHLSARRPEK